MEASKELATLVGEICEIVKVLYRVEPPNLPRPKVKLGDPATVELVQWSIRVYAYSLLCQFREILDSTVYLYDSGRVSAVFLCSRSLFETAAHGYYVKKHTTDHLSKSNYEAGWDFMLRINQGSRYMKEQSETTSSRMPAIELVEGPHISKVIACFDEYFKDHGEKEARRNYSFLSEFCHPNSFAFTNHLDFTQGPDDVVVTFSRPSPEVCIQALPDSWFSCMPLLFSLNKLLEACGDKTLKIVVEQFLEVIDPKNRGNKNNSM
jgi:hypothetical protein